MGNRIRFVPLKDLKKRGEPNHANLFWVQTKEFRCLAFLDGKGKWTNFYDGKKLNDFVKVVGR